MGNLSSRWFPVFLVPLFTKMNRGEARLKGEKPVNTLNHSEPQKEVERTSPRQGAGGKSQAKYNANMSQHSSLIPFREWIHSPRKAFLKPIDYRISPTQLPLPGDS